MGEVIERGRATHRKPVQGRRRRREKASRRTACTQHRP